MSTREVRLHHLIGRRVHDVDGRLLGRLEELRAEIDLHDRGNDYQVVEFQVGGFGAFGAMAAGRFTRHVLRGIGLAGDRYLIPWELVDLSDPERPRVTRRKSELRRE